MQAMFNDYIGIPFASMQSDKKGCDCWGLVRLLYRDFLKVDLPDYRIACDDASKIDAKVSEQKVEAWERVPFPCPAFSLIVMRFNSVTLCNHVGIYLGDGKFIHTAKKINSHITDINSPAWSRRIEGYYVFKEAFADGKYKD